MYQRFLGLALVAGCFAVPTVVRADDYNVDAVHSSVSFTIGHLGLSQVHGRFNSFAGTFTIDQADAKKSAFTLTIKTDSVDTNNAKRDEHLKSPDFFNVKQFPEIAFKSTGVVATKDGYLVSGELNLHGVAKPVTFALVGGKKAEFPKGVQRTGFSTDLVIKRSEWGMDKGIAQGISDEVRIAISLEGTKK